MNEENMEQLLQQRRADRMAREEDACWNHRVWQSDCTVCNPDGYSTYEAFRNS